MCPVTPSTPHLTSRLSSPHNTPWSKGSGSNTNYNTKHTQYDYQPYLKEDLNYKANISFDQFLHYVLNVPSDWLSTNVAHIENIINDKTYMKNVKKYAQPVDHETERYHPFITHVNHALSMIRKAINVATSLEVTLCRNDPIFVRGSHADRKPDNTFVEIETAQRGARGGVDDMSEKGPSEEPFCWLELLGFVEHKQVKSSLEFAFEPVGSVASGGTDCDTTSLRIPLISSTSTSLSPVPSERPFIIPKPRFTSISPSPNTSRQSTSRNHSPKSSCPTRSSSRLSNKRPLSIDKHSQSSNRSKRSKTHSEDSRTVSASYDNAILQCASYALELLSHGGLRSHVIGALVVSADIHLLYFDRSIIIVSEPINFIRDHGRFLTMLTGVASLSRRQWGYETLLTPPRVVAPAFPPSASSLRISTRIFEGFTLVLNTGESLLLGPTLYHQHGLIGRGTCVVRAQLQKSPLKVGKPVGGNSNLENRRLIVKISWSAKSRTSERILIDAACNAASTSEHSWVLDHLPSILHGEEIQDAPGSPQKSLLLLLGEKYEVRELRIIVQEELQPITELTTAEDFLLTFRGIFKCYEWLYHHPRVLHRDVSLNNLMFRRKGGKIFGVLNDFDLSVFRDATGASSKQRTGTKPYQAIDLLCEQPCEHKYRHDLESLFYVFIWVTSRYHDGVEIPNPPLQAWAERGGVELREAKMVSLSQPTPRLTSHFKALEGLVAQMRRALRDGLASRSDYEEAARPAQKVTEPQPCTHPQFDDDTLGGHVSFDVFRDILDFEI